MGDRQDDVLVMVRADRHGVVTAERPVPLPSYVAP
jgi:hypothetical protein